MEWGDVGTGVAVSRPDGGSAFPSHGIEECAGYNGPERFQVSQGGMSLRDWFAGQALACFTSTEMWCALRDDAKARSMEPHDLIARGAYEIADAMLKARGQ